MKQRRILIFNAKTLDRYAEEILIDGVKRNSLEVIEGDLSRDNHIDNFDGVIFQLHGAEISKDEDRKVIEILYKSLEENKKVKKIILVHRPDELQLNFPELKDFFSNCKEDIGLVFLGDKHVQDDFYLSDKVKIKVIPHGFAIKDNKLQTKPIVIGSHTTWGEMRSVEHLLKLMGEIYKINSVGHKVFGYLGGKPFENLEKEYILRNYGKIISEYQLEIINIQDFDISKFENYSNKNIIVVNSADKDYDFNMTFNVQMYYLGNKIRTGESSGTLHLSSGIPVILEMNGAEKIEDIQTIKISYGDVNNIESIDFGKGASDIIEVLNNGKYIEMAEHNLKQADFWNSKRIGEKYIEFFDELG